MKNKMTEKMDERLILDKVTEDTYYIVGAEIRARRFRLSMTLEALADGICSLSYLCKVETSKIAASRVVLEELCERIELTKEQVDTLLSLRDALEKCVIDYLNGCTTTIDYYFQKGKTFDNYRYSIIQFIYYISHKDFSRANLIYYDLLQISQTMREFDFIIFSLFSAYLHYYNFRFNEAIEILEKLNGFSLDKYLEALKCICLFKASFGANKIETLLYFTEVKKVLIERAQYELLDEMRYIVCLYLIKNDSLYFYNEEIDSIRKKEYKDSLDLITCFKDNNVSKVMNYDDKSLSKYAKMLKLYVTDFNEFKRLVDKYDNEYYIYDFDYNYLSILANRFSKKYHKVMFDEIIPRVCYSDDGFIRQVVMKEVACLDFTNKSRNLLRAYYLLYGNDVNFDIYFEGDTECEKQ